jgi:hypothetical protein
MLVSRIGLIGLFCQSIGCVAALAQAPSAVHARYEMFAADLPVAQVDAGFSIGPRDYRMNMAYHTTGLVGFFYRAHQAATVTGGWNGPRPVPVRFFGEGALRGDQRVTDIEYAQGRPLIRQLVPPNLNEREPVPEALQAGSIDTLSALVDLIRTVTATGSCELTVHTFDGRRATEIEAHTVGEETLPPVRRSVFSGRALRCDFAGRLLAGFKFGDDRVREGRPLHGSAWIAPAVPGGPKLPVRMQFETRWFGDATMYLTSSGPGADLEASDQ